MTLFPTTKDETIVKAIALNDIEKHAFRMSSPYWMMVLGLQIQGLR